MDVPEIAKLIPVLCGVTICGKLCCHLEDAVDTATGGGKETKTSFCLFKLLIYLVLADHVADALKRVPAVTNK